MASRAPASRTRGFRRMQVTMLVVLIGATGRFAYAQEVTNAAADPAPQQIGQPAPPAPTPAHTGLRALFKNLGADITHLPSRQNLLIAGLGAAAALAVHPIDDNINRHFAGDNVHSFFVPGKYMGQSYTLLGSAATIYTVGRVRHQPKVSHMGMDLIQSVVVAETMTQTLKYATRRERPDQSNARSFPSGHAADTFAFATALERHLNWKAWVPAYAIATYVASSRLHENRHFASDVAFGAAIGIIAGRTVTRHGRGTYAYSVVPNGRGVLVVVNRRPY